MDVGEKEKMGRVRDVWVVELEEMREKGDEGRVGWVKERMWEDGERVVW